MAKIKLQSKSATNEAAYTAIKNPEQAVFIIDCGSPEKAKELNDAFYKVAFVDNDRRYNKEVIGGELIFGWNVGKFFTAYVDPCDKAAAWCEEWLRNSDGAAPAIQGNSAGLESNGNEAISPKLALRKKLNTVDGFLKGLYAFNSVIGSSAKDLHDKGFDLDMGLGEKDACETEAKETLSDFDDYVEYNIVSEMEDGKPYWYVDIKFKPAFWELGDSELGEVLTLLNGAIEKYA